jgi:hypothetical protein
MEHHEEKISNKSVIIFKEHNFSLYFWNKFKILVGKSVNIFTLDSHCDYAGGFIYVMKSSRFEWEAFYSLEKLKKFNLDELKSFTSCQEFRSWDLSDANLFENFHKEPRYLKKNNDNFIDIAFMKDVIKDVYSLYIEDRTSRSEYESCNDYKNKKHNFFRKPFPYKELPLSQSFILDIDLDFFTVQNPDNYDFNIIGDIKLKNSLDLIKNLFENKNCLGLTIAKEPNHCGCEKNSKKLLNRLLEALKN